VDESQYIPDYYHCPKCGKVSFVHRDDPTRTYKCAGCDVELQPITWKQAYQEAQSQIIQTYALLPRHPMKAHQSMLADIAKYVEETRAESRIKITERGWGGYVPYWYGCLYRRNTLIQRYDTKVVVATCGALAQKDGTLRPLPGTYASTVQKGLQGVYYMTGAFHPRWNEQYKEWVSVGTTIPLQCRTCITEPMMQLSDMDVMHDAAVDEVRQMFVQNII
jgi:hypothetical protein